MGRKALDNSARDSVILLVGKGLTWDEIEAITGLSRPTISRIIKADKFAKTGNRDELRKMLTKGTRSHALWACEKYGINLDEKPKEAPVEKKAPPTECDIEDAIHVSTRLMTDKICEAIRLQGEAICKKLDQLATVIQSCSKGEVEKANANADIAYQEMQKQTEKLVWIQSAVKGMKVVK